MELRSVRREIKLTRKENKVLEYLMQQEVAENFSDYARKRLLETYPNHKIIEKVLSECFNIELLHEIQNISRDIGIIRGVIEGKEEIKEEHISIILNCVQNLIREVDKILPLSDDFKEKYIFD